MTASWDPTASTAIIWARQILAARGLTDAPDDRVWEWATTDLERTRRALAQHRLVAAAAASLASSDLVPGDLSDWLRGCSRDLGLRSLVHLGVASRFRDALAADGMDALFVKGAFQSAQSTGDPAFRGPGDIDVVVRPEEFDAVVELMVGQGARHVEYDALPALRERIASVHHATSLVMFDSHIDLHRRLDPAPHLMCADFDDLWARRDVVAIDRQSFPTLHPIDTAVHVGSHGCQDNWPRLRHVVDFVLALDAARAGASLDDMHARAAQLGVDRRFRISIEVARMLQPDLPPQGDRARAMAHWAWSRHRQGRVTFGSDATRDVLSSFAYWTLSQGDRRSIAYGAKRLMWLPSAMGDSPLPEPLWWAYPVMAPVNVVRRVLTRRARHQRAL